MSSKPWFITETKANYLSIKSIVEILCLVPLILKFLPKSVFIRILYFSTFILDLPRNNFSSTILCKFFANLDMLIDKKEYKFWKDTYLSLIHFSYRSYPNDLKPKRNFHNFKIAFYWFLQSQNLMCQNINQFISQLEISLR